MRARASLYRTSVLTTVASLGVAGLALMPAAGSTATAATATRKAAQPVSRWNVGAPHSPELLRQLRHAHTGRAPRRGGRTAAVTLTASTAVQGVDVASYQHPKSTTYPNGEPIDWQKVESAGVQFAAVKAIEGSYYTNPYAASDLQQAHSAGLSVIAYAFGIPNDTASASAQADDLVTFLNGGTSGTPVLSPLPPTMLDIEYDPYWRQDGTNICYGLTKSAMRTWIEGFANEIASKTGSPPIIYSTRDWLDTCAGNTAALAKYPLWVASYTGTSSPGMLPSGWTDWGLWQYTSAGTVPGIPTGGGTDLDWFNPDSVFQPGQLMAFNPGYQQDVAGSGASVSAQVNAYPLEANPSLTFNASAAGSAVPANGWSLSPDPGQTTAQITGTAAATPTSIPITVTVTDSTSGVGGQISFNWYSHGTLKLVSPGDQSTVAGAPVDLNLAKSLTDSPSEPPVSFAAAGLPPGLTMTTAGQITGWPDAKGTYQVLIRATDNLMAPASEKFTWKVTAAPNTGPTGPFRLNLGGKCLNDVGNRSSDGNPADIWTCNGSAAQQWTYVQDFTVRIHGKCLTAPATAGAKVTIQPCDSLGSQVWRPLSPRSVNTAAGSAPLALVNPPSGLCLADPGASRTNGTRVVAASCDGLQDQAWAPPRGPVGSQLPGNCLDDRGNKTANGTPIDLWPCTGGARQQWTAKADGTFRIHGKCLTVRNNAKSSGTRVELWTCKGIGGQQWRLTPDGDGADLVNPRSGLCLTDPGNATAKGTQLRIKPCAAQPGQRWHVG